MLLIPSIRELFWGLVKESDSAKTMALEARYQTRYGWGGFSGFEYTFKCTMGIIFVCYLIEKDLKNNRNIMWIGIGIILFVGTLFYGRIGSLVSMVIIAVIGLRLLMKRPKILASVIVGVIVGTVVLFILQSKNEAIQAWFEWAFDLFLTFFRTGKFETYSSNVLLEEMLFIPETRTVLFGDGMYTTSEGYYMFTDAGIMRTILFGGIIFSIIRYASAYLILGLNILKDNLKQAERTMYFWILFVCFIFEIKGEIIFSCLPIFIWLIVIDKYKKGTRKWREI